jgi:hypothetical protein
VAEDFLLVSLAWVEFGGEFPLAKDKDTVSQGKDFGQLR